ncbi:MAG: cysteine dioxygenase [Frankia sp.]
MPLLHPALLTGATPAALATLVPDAVLEDAERTLPIRALTGLTGRLAAADWLWRPLVRHDPNGRWYTRLMLSGVVEVWLIGWNPGQSTPVHDHGGAMGAMTVVDGILTEEGYSPDWSPTFARRHTAGRTLGFPAHHIHRVSGAGAGPATSIHAYSPPGLPMRLAPELLAEPTAPTGPAVTAGKAVTVGDVVTVGKAVTAGPVGAMMAT